ncbi:MAG: hypothetical protein M3R57_01005, partial [Chloroflexota bacterium]|nr:hypothetical protein [Chloroflexota bacterium]
GLTGSGPTLWCLYPSRSEADAAATRVNEALAGGFLAAPGEGPPFVAAATILAGDRPASVNPPATHDERSDR